MIYVVMQYDDPSGFDAYRLEADADAEASVNEDPEVQLS